MKRILSCSLVLAALALAGCSGCKTFAQAADTFANLTVGPEYEAYVNADPDLTADERSIRLLNLQTFRSAVAVAKEE